MLDLNVEFVLVFLLLLFFFGRGSFIIFMGFLIEEEEMDDVKYY